MAASLLAARIGSSPRARRQAGAKAENEKSGQDQDRLETKRRRTANQFRSDALHWPSGEKFVVERKGD
jgi:hypothetical protein